MAADQPDVEETGLGWPVSRETIHDEVSRETEPGQPSGLGWPA